MSAASESNRVPNDSPAIRLIQIILAIGLVGTLFGAGRRIYRTLPPAFGAPGETIRSGTPQDLTIIFRAAVSAADTRINLYPIDFSATERDYLMNARPGKTLEDFLARRLQNVEPVKVSVDSSGQAVARVSEGNWWMHATSALTNGESMEWRVPLTISRNPQTIELSSDNAYERTKKF
jgi:predicted ATPase